MNSLRNLIGIFAFSMLVLCLPSFASAQYRSDRDDDDGYSRSDDDRNDRNNRNNRNNRNDDYRNNRGSRSNGNLQSTVRDLKNRSQQFKKRLDRDLDNSRYDGDSREDRINRLAKDFADAAKNLDDRYDNRGDYNRSSGEAQRVLQLGDQLDRAVSRARLNGNSQNEWNRIRQDLDALADAYNYDNNNNNNRNNRRNRQSSGDWRNNIPFPLPF